MTQLDMFAGPDLGYRSPVQELEAKLRAQGCTVHPRVQHHARPQLRRPPPQKHDPGRSRAAWATVLGWWWRQCG